MNSLSILLEGLYDELTDVARNTRTIYKNAKSQNRFTEERKLKREYREIFGRDKISLEQILGEWIPTWKGKMSPNGYHIRLGDEAYLFGLEPEKQVTVYELYSLISSLFKDSKYYSKN